MRRLIISAICLLMILLPSCNETTTGDSSTPATSQTTTTKVGANGYPYLAELSDGTNVFISREIIIYPNHLKNEEMTSGYVSTFHSKKYCVNAQRDIANGISEMPAKEALESGCKSCRLCWNT